MSKRGQVTMFIVIGLVLLFLFAVFFSSEQSVQRIEQSTPSFDASLPRYVESCLQKTAEEAILDNSRQGGYFILPEEATGELAENVPYYRVNGEFHIPSDQTLAEQIGLYVDTMLDFCLDNFKPFAVRGVNITSGTPQTRAILSPTALQLTTTLLVVVTEKSQMREYRTFSAVLNVTQFYEDALMARTIAETTNRDRICLSCFSDEAAQGNVYVGILPVDDAVTVFELRDDDYIINTEKVYFRFGVRHDGE